MRAPSGLQVPDDWERIARGGPGPFVTWADYRRPDQHVVRWNERRHRTGFGPRSGTGARSGYRATDRLAWWVAVVFVVGSALFVAGAAASLAPSLFGGQETMSVVAEGCYTVGALLYTVAVYGQVLESLNADDRIAADGACRPPDSWRWFAVEPTRLGFLWPAVFLVGALVFNYETAVALLSALGAVEDYGAWWTSLIGAVLFGVASLLQGLEVTSGRDRPVLGDVSFWVALMFLLGSIGFVVGALPGFDVETGGVPAAKHEPGASVVKVGFLLGGLAFLVGSALMLPELDRELQREVDPAAETR